MPRIPQPPGQRGSLKWIQRATNERWPSLDGPVLRNIGGATEIEWLSPRTDDNFAEYRDAAFLQVLGRADLAPSLKVYWPAGGPQWDALGRTDRGDLLLVEAKAHVAEMCSPGTSASAKSRAQSEKVLDSVAAKLGARSTRAALTDYFYQLANRLAHLDFLRTHGASAYLVLVNFLNDDDMAGPRTAEAWDAAYEVAFHVMGLSKRHALSPYIIEVFPDVSAAGDLGGCA